MNLRLGQNRRRAVSGILVAVIIFAMLFTAGTGYLFFQAKSNLSSYQANVQALQQRAQISQEQLVFRVSLNLTTDTLEVTVNDTGAFPISIVDTFVNDSAGKVITPPGVMILGGPCTDVGGPLNLNVGGTRSFEIKNSCYTYASGIIHVALVTSRGNVFTQQYPLNNNITVSTITIEKTTHLVGPNAGGAGGNSLVVVMAATPIQVFSGTCSAGSECITVNVTVFNYSRDNMTNAGLHPSMPWSNVTGTAKVINSNCSGPYTPPGKVPDPNRTIPGYDSAHARVVPHIYFLCTYAPQTGAVGGLASFSGWANATQNKTVLDSASAVSNLVQVGGLTNVFAQGIFSTNSFFFKYSSCTNAPTAINGGYSYSTACTTNIAPDSWPPSSPNNLREGAIISGGSNYYVAFYIQITNNYNTTVPLLQYTFLQVDPSAGGETDWWLVGTNMSNGVYYPTYNPGSSPLLPTLTAYPSDCDVVNPKTNVPIDNKCIYVNPGQTVTITLAACGYSSSNYSSSNWNWGGSRYGDFWDNGGDTPGCITGGLTPQIGCISWSSTPPISCISRMPGDATAATTVISFEYNGQTLTEDIAFNGIAFTS